MYSSPIIIRVLKTRRMRWAGHVARKGEKRGACKFWWGKPVGKRQLGRPRRRLEYNIKMDLQEGPATGHLDTGFSWFPCIYKQMLRWFPRFQVATTCFTCSPPDLNSVVTNFMFCIHVK